MNIGPTELLVILVIALIVFGPRKLPELGKQLGQAMAQFRRASDDFKRSWEQEVELEKVRKSETHSPDSAQASAESMYDHTYGSPEATSPVEHDQAHAGVTSPTEPVAATASATSEKPRSEHWI